MKFIKLSLVISLIFASPVSANVEHQGAYCSYTIYGKTRGFKTSFYLSIKSGKQSNISPKDCIKNISTDIRGTYPSPRAIFQPYEATYKNLKAELTYKPSQAMQHPAEQLEEAIQSNKCLMLEDSLDYVKPLFGANHYEGIVKKIPNCQN